MTEVLRVTQAAAEVAAQSDAPDARISQVAADVADAAIPNAVTTHIVGKVAAQSDDPGARISQTVAEVAVQANDALVHVSQVAVQVLVGWRIKQGFQAIWVD